VDEKKHNYKLMIAYDGTPFSGWQVQPNSVTIQEKLQNAIEIIAQEKITVHGSGRTDTGVHALAQVAHFKTTKPLDTYKLRASMNGLLPVDIRVLDIQEVPLDFHARYSAIGKCYYYHLCLEKVQLPFHRLYSWHVKQAFDLALLKEAPHHFVGEHDFTSFANEAHAGSAAKNPVRNLYRLDVVEEDGGVRLEFEGSGFLYKMVRNIVGTLHEVATGKIAVANLPKILEAKDRRQAGPAAPPQGLFLAYVLYP
jgi:tRNA pseudouridine38-40 synthase